MRDVESCSTDGEKLLGNFCPIPTRKARPPYLLCAVDPMRPVCLDMSLSVCCETQLSTSTHMAVLVTLGVTLATPLFRTRALQTKRRRHWEKHCRRHWKIRLQDAQEGARTLSGAPRSPTPCAFTGVTRGVKRDVRLVQRMGGGGVVANLSSFWEGMTQKNYTGDIFDQPLDEIQFGASLPTMLEIT